MENSQIKLRMDQAGKILFWASIILMILSPVCMGYFFPNQNSVLHFAINFFFLSIVINPILLPSNSNYKKLFFIEEKDFKNYKWLGVVILFICTVASILIAGFETTIESKDRFVILLSDILLITKLAPAICLIVFGRGWGILFTAFLLVAVSFILHFVSEHAMDSYALIFVQIFYMLFIAMLVREILDMAAKNKE